MARRNSAARTHRQADKEIILVMRTLALGAILLAGLAASAEARERHIIVLDPGHSHAAAVLAHPIPGISNEVRVYAPPGEDVKAFLNSVSQFNHRPRNPTHWSLAPYIGADFLQRMLLEPPGNVVVISGRNDRKIDRILSSLRAGQNVLADKPWIIDSKDLPMLETALNTAGKKQLIAYDGMTERFNIAYRIQRELMRDPGVFGHPVRGTPSDPAVQLENLHSLVKFSSGKVSLRPAWFFDVRQQGEGIADVGTHLIDLEMWTLFPGEAVDYRRDVKVLEAGHTPLYLTQPQFERVTGEKAWPEFLHPVIQNDRLEYYCNNTALFTVRGIYAAIRDRWEYESVGALSDSYLVLYRGSRATVRVRQTKKENYVPEIDVIPNAGVNRPVLIASLEHRLKLLAAKFPDLSLQNNGTEIRIVIPQEDRERGGPSFAQLVNGFLGYVREPQTLPYWEKPNMLAKYYITTKAVDLARATPQ
jgi:predicted dehydrogenase